MDGIGEIVALAKAFAASGAKLPEYPSEDGSYVLKATVSSGTVTLSWESAE